MDEWPRELKGHTIAKKIDFVRSGGGRRESAEAVYLCVRCGVRFEGPDDPSLERTACRQLTREWQE